MSEFVVKRVYEPAEKSDGYRVLVDRLWPRGISKERADLDLWDKDIAPSAQIRKEFGHKAEMFDWFKAQYLGELTQNPAVGEFYKKVEGKPKVTLVYAAKDPRINHAVILRDFLAENQPK